MEADRRDGAVEPNIIPSPHPDAWVNLVRAYVAETVEALTAAAVPVRRSWLDPADPRDATIVCCDFVDRAHPHADLALVWDEETGWRRGGFVDGDQGRRTTLVDAVHLGGGVVPRPEDLAARFVAGAVTRPRKYRNYHDMRDGLDDILSTWGTR